MKIRSNSWGAANLSWSVVIEETLHAMEQLGHQTCFLSTNGIEGMRYYDSTRAAKDLITEAEIRNSGQHFDIDLTYTAPSNFSHRFLPSSGKKMAIYCYESSVMPPIWKQYYRFVDYVLPASNFVAEMFKRNGCPENKIKVVPHGVDLDVFNMDVAPYQIGTKKTFKFLCIAEEHYRKQIDKLIQIYCHKFTAKDDVCLVLKTKLKTPKQGFEMDLRPAILEEKRKYGDKMPEIKVIQERLPSLAPLYTACDAFVSITASEGFCLPFLESIACGLPVIAPRYGGHLDFLNDQNALLCDCGTRNARPQEIYWGSTEGRVGNPSEEHFGQLMIEMFKDHKNINNRLSPEMKKTAEQFTWKNSAQKILDLA